MGQDQESPTWKNNIQEDVWSVDPYSSLQLWNSQFWIPWISVNFRGEATHDILKAKSPPQKHVLVLLGDYHDRYYGFLKWTIIFFQTHTAYGGFLEWRCPKMEKFLMEHPNQKWMIWWYPPLRKPPYSSTPIHHGSTNFSRRQPSWARNQQRSSHTLARMSTARFNGQASSNESWEPQPLENGSTVNHVINAERVASMKQWTWQEKNMFWSFVGYVCVQKIPVYVHVHRIGIKM